MPRHNRGWGMGLDPGPGQRHSSLTTSLLEPTLLILVKKQPSHGYSLLNELGSFGLGALHPSLVYRTLREMEMLEWIQSDWDTDQTQGPPRRTYHLTPQGEDALQYWKQELGRTNEVILQLLKQI